MAGLALVATIAQGVGTLVSVAGAVKAGNEAAAQTRYEAQVQGQQADAALASGQSQAAAIYRDAQYIESRQRAVAAAQGGGDDASVINEIGLTKMEASVAAETTLAGAQTAQSRYEDASVVSGINARRQRTGGVLDGLSAGISGGVSMYDRFAKRQRYG